MRGRTPTWQPNVFHLSHPDSPFGQHFAERMAYWKYNDRVGTKAVRAWVVITVALSALTASGEDGWSWGSFVGGAIAFGIFVGFFVCCYATGAQRKDPMVHIDGGFLNLSRCQCLDCNPDKRWALEQEQVAWLQYPPHYEMAQEYHDEFLRRLHERRRA